ncbi:MAG: SDR family oxidoreductase [Xanthobacteraceae bacterium]|nr:SDR family oxidoreductase [Xanthobacteraceae bacterium]
MGTTLTLQGRRALVTGGGKGIGAAVAALFAEAGAQVVIADIDSETAEALAARIGARAIALDVASPADVQAFVGREAPFDILVNNAGVDQHAFFTETTPADWSRLLAANLTSVLACTHAVLPGMQRAGYGRIVNVASEAARLGSKGGAVYAAAKGGVLAFTKSIARESARFGITVNAVTPGPISTPMLDEAVRQGGPKLLEAMTGATLLRRLGTAAEVAAAVLFLASDQASYITGETLGVSGGMGVGG